MSAACRRLVAEASYVARPGASCSSAMTEPLQRDRADGVTNPSTQLWLIEMGYNGPTSIYTAWPRR